MEFAVVAPLMILLTFGLIELGRLSMLKETAVHASREAARLGIKPSATESDVADRANEELDLFGLNGSSVDVQFTGGNGDPAEVSVAVEIPLAGNTWIPEAITATITSLRGETVMRRESTW